jgi:uncharacterized RDD family membrane protein YckC
MEWYHAEGGEQLGPFTDEQFAELIRAGTVTGDTLVWNETLADWQPYGRLARAAPAIPDRPAEAPETPPARMPVPDDGRVACSLCGNRFAPDEVIDYEGASICAGCKPRFLQQLREGAALPGVVAYGGFWIRALAKILDGLILWIVNVVISLAGAALIVPMTTSDGPETAVLLVQFGMWALQVAVAAAYTTVFLGRYGATPGKMACRLKVIRSDGSPLTYGRGFGRYWGDMLSGLILYIGYIMAAFDEEKRALHDRICDTRVIKTG